MGRTNNSLGGVNVILIHEQYLAAWVIYVLAGMGLFLAFRALTRFITYAPLRDVMRALWVVFLFMPWPSYGAEESLAPAFLIAAFEGLTQTYEQGLRAGIPLSVAMLATGSVVFLLSLLLRRKA